MKGKIKVKGKLAKTLLLILSFVLTIVITASATLAWFYDSDWANETVTMAGAVGIEMRDSSGATSGAGKFHFTITSDLAYPGQAIDVEASVFNNGGSSITNYFSGKTYNNSGTYNSSTNYNDTDIANAGNGKTDNDYSTLADNVGSACYVRARFVIYTDIGKEDAKYATPPTAPSEPNFNTATETELETYYAQVKAYKEYQEYLANRTMSAQELYEAMVNMITANNGVKSGYDWVFWENTSPTVDLDGTKYYEGKQQTASSRDGGYFYLCYDTTDATNNITAQKTLLPLNVGTEAAFLWDGTFVIPWQLTNLSADRTIFVAVEFQAIQTYIPLISVGADTKGTISGLANNQLPAGFCYYNDISVQTIFNTSRFTNFEELTTDKNGRVYSQDATCVKASLPDSSRTGTVYNSGTAQPNAYTPPAS